MQTSYMLQKKLQELYDEFLKINDLPSMSADELILEVSKPAQRDIRVWLQGFIMLWEETYR